jgi:murein DD-endopeptidase MepM/ murein hydrolase activator NlpD
MNFSQRIRAAPRFHPVVKLPSDYYVFDFSKGQDPRAGVGIWGVGKYDECRAGVYVAELFQSPKGPRNIHMGIDISGPVGTDIFAFDDGEIFLTAFNNEPGSYGWTLITKHFAHGDYYVLWGHLNEASVKAKKPKEKFLRGDVIAQMGDFSENGGWPPHLHFQISIEMPTTCDLPGAVAWPQRDEALKKYPDPRLILGELY